MKEYYVVCHNEIDLIFMMQKVCLALRIAGEEALINQPMASLISNYRIIRFRTVNQIGGMHRFKGNGMVMSPRFEDSANEVDREKYRILEKKINPIDTDDYLEQWIDAVGRLK